jgi:hypothetical protein
MNLPELFVTGLDERGHFIFRRWCPPPVEDFATPADLARLITAFRKWVQASSGPGFRPITEQGAISEQGLAQLLLLAYQASFYTEEGRCTRARLFVPDVDEQAHPVRINHLFRPPKPLGEPKGISQLAPTLAAEDSALVVQETAGELACVGIGLLDAADAGRPLLGMPRGWTRAAGGLQVQILAPGELRVSEGRAEYTLRANRILAYSWVASSAQVDRWIEELTLDLTGWCSAQDKDWAARPLTVPGADVRALWSHVLREAVRLRHGGAFVVVPDPRQAPIELKHPTEPLALGGELANVWLALARAYHLLGSNLAADALERTRVQRHQLWSTAASVGHLSAVDGCVVLDRRMTVHGFGGTIEVTRAEDARAGASGLRTYADARTCAPLAEEPLLARFGHRHRSAFLLCKAVPNAIAFVISQDGDLPVFSSDDRHVYCDENLSP